MLQAHHDALHNLHADKRSSEDWTNENLLQEENNHDLTLLGLSGTGPFSIGTVLEAVVSKERQLGDASSPASLSKVKAYMRLKPERLYLGQAPLAEKEDPMMQERRWNEEMKDLDQSTAREPILADETAIALMNTIIYVQTTGVLCLGYLLHTGKIREPPALPSGPQGQVTDAEREHTKRLLRQKREWSQQLTKAKAFVQQHQNLRSHFYNRTPHQGDKPLLTMDKHVYTLKRVYFGAMAQVVFEWLGLKNYVHFQRDITFAPRAIYLQAMKDAKAVESYLETGTRDDRIYNGIASMLSKWPQEHASAASAAS